MPRRPTIMDRPAAVETAESRAFPTRSTEAAPAPPALDREPEPRMSARRDNAYPPDAARPHGLTIETSVGGVMYLLNVALALGFYGDFTSPAHASIDLPIWDFVGLTGRQLTPRGFRRDPIWRVLASLGGRRRPRRTLPMWVSQSLLPPVRERLALGLGVADVRLAGRLLCVQRARVVTSSSHVDVYFSLASHPLAIRLAGLDRDAGWIPSADRVVTFHYD